MCVYMFTVCAYTCTYGWICCEESTVYIHTHVTLVACAYMHICVYSYLNGNTFVVKSQLYTYIHMWTLVACVHLYICIYVHMYICIFAIHVYICIYMYIFTVHIHYTHIFTTHIYTYLLHTYTHIHYTIVVCVYT